MQKRFDAAQAITGRHREQRKPRCRDSGYRDYVPQARARQEQHAKTCRKENGRGAEIGFRQQQDAHEADQPQRLHQAGKRASQLLFAAYGVTCEIDQHKNPCQLGHLEVEPEQAQPSSAAVDRVSEPRDEDDDQQHERDYQERHRDALQQVGANAEQQCRATCARERQDELALEIEKRLTAFLARDRDRRGRHHHEPEQHDTQGDRNGDRIDVDNAALTAGACVRHR